MPLIGLGPSKRCKPDSPFRGEGSWCGKEEGDGSGSPRRPEEGAQIWGPSAA